MMRMTACITKWREICHMEGPWSVDEQDNRSGQLLLTP